MEPDRTRIDERGIKPPPAFTIAAEQAGGAVVVRLEGELDLAASGSLRAHVDAAAGSPLVLDLGRVTFVDSSAVRDLVRARLDVAARGDRLVLAAVPPVVMRILELTRTATLFDVAATREAALERLLA
jgi:anti-anti-sigma factor